MSQILKTIFFPLLFFSVERESHSFKGIYILPCQNTSRCLLNFQMHFSVQVPWNSLRNRFKTNSVYLLTATIMHFVSFHLMSFIWSTWSPQKQAACRQCFREQCFQPCISSTRSLMKSSYLQLLRWVFWNWLQKKLWDIKSRKHEFKKNWKISNMLVSTTLPSRTQFRKWMPQQKSEDTVAFALHSSVSSSSLANMYTVLHLSRVLEGLLFFIPVRFTGVSSAPPAFTLCPCVPQASTAEQKHKEGISAKRKFPTQSWYFVSFTRSLFLFRGQQNGKMFQFQISYHISYECIYAQSLQVGESHKILED